MLYRFVLEYWRYWPDQPEGQLRGSLRAAVADMRHVQGFLLDWAHPETSHSGPHEAHLGKVGGDIARKLGELADRLEKEMGGGGGRSSGLLPCEARSTTYTVLPPRNNRTGGNPPP